MDAIETNNNNFNFLILINFIFHEQLLGYKIKKKKHLGVVAQADYNKYIYRYRNLYKNFFN